MRYLFIFIVISCLSACVNCEECPAPPSEFKFQVVNILGHDLTRGKDAPYNSNAIRLTFWEYNLEHEIILKQDTFDTSRTIFSANNIPNIVERGVNKFGIYLDANADTIRVDMSFVKTYCCEYSLYKSVTLNKRELKYAPDNDFVLLLDKR